MKIPLRLQCFRKALLKLWKVADYVVQDPDRIIAQKATLKTLRWVVRYFQKPLPGQPRVQAQTNSLTQTIVPTEENRLENHFDQTIPDDVVAEKEVSFEKNK